MIVYMYDNEVQVHITHKAQIRLFYQAILVFIGIGVFIKFTD